MSATAVAPRTIQGSVVDDYKSPDAVSRPESFPAHKFVGVVRRLVTNAHGAFHTEAELEDALNVLSEYEHHLIHPADRQMVITEGDPAAHEDVTLRRPPNSVGVVSAPAGPIDYDKLARAIVAAQRAAVAVPEQPEAFPSGSESAGNPEASE